jgi:zinc-ribbon domain
LLHCPSCGKEVADNAAFCPNCGFSLSSRMSTPTGAGTSPASPSGGTDFERSNGLGKLKNSFLLYLIGGIIAIVPVVGGIGGLVEFAGFIFMILGWRALGRSSFASAQNYKSTGKWLVYFIIIAIVVGAVGSIAIFAYVFSTAFSTAAAGNPPNPNSFLQGPGYQSLTTGFSAVIAAIGVVGVLLWNKVRSSLAHLGAEISQPSLTTAGWIFLLSAVIVLGASALEAFATFTGATTYGSTGYGPFYFGTVAGDLVLAAAGYFGYQGTKRASEGLSAAR